jgi:Protein of unknown function (DUF2865)
MSTKLILRWKHALGEAGQAPPEFCMHNGTTRRETSTRLGACLCVAIAGVLVHFAQNSVFAQSVDCASLSSRIAALGEGGQKSARNYSAALQKTRADLDRTIRQARALNCDRPQFFLFDPAPAQCPGLNAQIRQLQANLAYFQAGGDNSATARQQLTASYNAYCRTQARAAPAQQPERNFFEQLFSMFSPNRNPAFQNPPAEQVLPLPGEDFSPRGGSQALCVRGCDGGFFPLSVAAHGAEPEQLTELCQALCPNTEVSVYTRSPYQDIKTAVSLDGVTPYSDLPNAFRFQKGYDSTCTCKPPGQSWAEALAPAEQLLGRVSKTDILVTPEKSAELARPKLAPTVKPGLATQPRAAGGDKENSATAEGQSATQEITGPDGVKRRVRIIVPPL